MAIMELRKKSQVTIPLELVSKMGLKPGDKLEVIEKDGVIYITPVVIYPKSEMERIAKLIKEAEEEKMNGKTKVYNDVYDAFKDMGIMWMDYKIEFSTNFVKQLKKLSQNDQKIVFNKVKLIAQNPFYPSLRTKKIQGFNSLFECSVNMDIRILWKYEDGIILLLDVGHHDILR